MSGGGAGSDTGVVSLVSMSLSRDWRKSSRDGGVVQDDGAAGCGEGGEDGGGPVGDDGFHLAGGGQGEGKLVGVGVAPRRSEW